MTCLQIHLFFLLLDQIYVWRYGVDFSVQSLCSSAPVFMFGSFFIISLPIEFLILFMCIVFLILFVYLCSYNSLRFFKMIVQNPLSSSSQIFIYFGLSTWIFLFVPSIVMFLWLFMFLVCLLCCLCIWSNRYLSHSLWNGFDWDRLLLASSAQYEAR